MKYKLAFASVLIVGLLAAGCSSTTSTSQNTTSSTSSTQSTTTAQATNSVTISNYAFSPSSITVKKGTTVTWTNQDAVSHTVTDDDASVGGPASQLIPQGQTYTFTFNTAGTFTYHCQPHPYMKGTVIVTE